VTLSGAIVDVVVEKAVGLVGACFDNDTKGEIRLCRFRKMKEAAVRSAEETIRFQVEEFTAETAEEVRTIFRTSRGQTIDVEKLKNAIGDCIMAYLILPVLPQKGAAHGPFEFFNKIKSTSPPVEVCAAARTVYMEQVRNINKAIDALGRIRDC